jgi:hypothetical protein
VWQDMEHVKLNVYKLYLIGSSMHNQVQISLILEIMLCSLNNLLLIIHLKKSSHGQFIHDFVNPTFIWEIMVQIGMHFTIHNTYPLILCFISN